MTAPVTTDLARLELLAWAIEAAGRGWKVFPLRPGDKRPAGHSEKRCPGTGRCAGGHRMPEQRATTDIDLINAAWTRQPYNVAIATGPSGLLVVDLDVPKDSGATTVVDLHGHQNDPGFLADVVYVGRPLNKAGWNLPGHPLANPFPVGRNTTRADAVERYRAWLADHPELLERHLPALRGKRLGCWCPPDQPCHARVLAELLNRNTGAPDGATAFQALCERAGQAVPDTYRVRTPSGGEHLYFLQPPGARLHSTAGRLAKKIDTRGWGGYVVAAGSTTPHGAYTVIDDRPPVTLPAWLHEALNPPQRPNHAMANFMERRSGYAAAALRNEVRNVATAADGTRNATLLRAARALGRLIASGDLTRAEVEEALSRAAAGNATQSQRYYDDVIRRGLDWSIAHNPAGKREAA